MTLKDKVNQKRTFSTKHCITFSLCNI